MIVKIKSTNPELMSLLRKNPSSFNGIQLRKIKNGVAIGRMISPKEYHLIFQDTKYSFCRDFSNQIDYQSYCNPRVFLSMASRFLRHILYDEKSYWSEDIPWLKKKVGEVDLDTHTTTFEFVNVYADGYNFSKGFVLEKYLDGVELKYKKGNLFSLIITANTVFEATNLASLVMMYLASTNKESWYINGDMARKYIRILNNIPNVPYFVLYLFARRCLPSRELFDNLSEELASSSKMDISLEWGNTQSQRINAVENILLKKDIKVIDQSILEIGCGELDYARNFLKYLDCNSTWYASDIKDYSDAALRISKSFPGKNLVFVEDLERIEPVNSGIMLAVEVIEHMPYSEAISLMKDKINYHHPAEVIITTPNVEFNQFYSLEGFRHDDHCFELTPKEFKEYVDKIIPDENYNIEFFGIGDCVNGHYMSLGCHLVRK